MADQGELFRESSRIPRLHLFELEDQAWLPAAVRNFATDSLQFGVNRFGLYRPVVALLAEALRKSGSKRIIDLCSGSGGPLPPLRNALAAEGVFVEVTLTDLFPNVQAFQRAADESPGSVAFVAEPVDARAVPRHLTGFRTIFNSFHHFRPEQAVALLRDAALAGQPIGIFELPDRSFRTLIPMLFLTPLFNFLTTPFIRPFRWRRLFWTYVIPLVPLTNWWDGIVSQLRAYTPDELRHLADAAAVDAYTWKAGRVPVLYPYRGYITYLLGIPGNDA